MQSWVEHTQCMLVQHAMQLRSGGAEDSLYLFMLVISLCISSPGSVRLQDARGPVQAVLCENWAVYHFWSTSSQRHEMAVIELYDVTPRDMSVAHVLFAADNATQSAYLPPPLEVSRHRLMLAVLPAHWKVQSCEHFNMHKCITAPRLQINLHQCRSGRTMHCCQGSIPASAVTSTHGRAQAVSQRACCLMHKRWQTDTKLLWAGTDADVCDQGGSEGHRACRHAERHHCQAAAAGHAVGAGMHFCAPRAATWHLLCCHLAPLMHPAGSA